MSNLPIDSQISSSGGYQVTRSGGHPELDRNLMGDYEPDTRVSTYEKLSSFLIASIIIMGMMTLIGFMIWMTMFEWGSHTIVTPMQEQFGNDDRPEGVADDWQEPGVEEFPEVEQPQLADALEALTDAVSSVAAQLEKVDGNALQMGTGPGLGDIRERGKGRGNSRLVPEAQRWRIEYSASSMGEYRTQLDFFKIELGALSKTTGRIDLIRDLTRPTPTRDFTSRVNEKRLYFSHTQQNLRRWDQRIAQDAGVTDILERIIVQFYGEPTRQNLRDIEDAYIKQEGRELLEVQRTFYRIRPRGNGYEFYVHKVEYRLPPDTV